MIPEAIEQGWLAGFSIARCRVLRFVGQRSTARLDSTRLNGCWRPQVISASIYRSLESRDQITFARISTTNMAHSTQHEHSRVP